MNTDDLAAAVRSFGASDVACAPLDDGPSGLPWAVSVVVRLSDGIVDEIGTGLSPTYTYFNHYRTVNYLIDQILLKTGLWLQERGSRYITVAGSQSDPSHPFAARYSHKQAACSAGMGRIGRNNLFLHREWGSRVRLGTVCTDWPGCASLVPDPSKELPARRASREDFLSCAGCGSCAAACPAKAIGSAFDPALCSAWMKKAYHNIGRGAVCGICMTVCPENGGKK
jgi:epoxyqueuosine reductase